MKTSSEIFYLLFFFFSVTNTDSLSQDIDFRYQRIESAFQQGEMIQIEDLFNSQVTIRIIDSLYTNISGITAIELVNVFFSNKDSIQFYFSNTRSLNNRSGKLIYNYEGKRDTTYVDVNIYNLLIVSMNISNRPSSTWQFR